MLVGHHFLLLRDLGLYVIMFENVCVIIVAMVSSSFAVKGLRASCDYNRCQCNTFKGGLI
jgi:hypothetical protein